MEYNPQDLIPAGNKVLIQPGPLKLIKQKLNLPDPIKNVNKKPTQLHKVEPKEFEVRTLYHMGKVLLAGTESIYKEGDYVIYKVGQGSQFDLMAKHTSDEKCPVWIDTYSIYATLSEEGVAKFENKFNEYVEEKELQSESSESE